MRTIAFRFFFIYFLLTIAPWFWFYRIPGVSYLTAPYESVDKWTVDFFNGHFLHVKDILNDDGGGSGDTSYGWAQFYTYLILSVMGCLVWTLVDRKRTKYITLDFILKNVVRYNVIIVAFAYGIYKLFALQMPFPNLNQLATPLGDFLPMRLCWMFMGYSTSYQVFSGIMEVLVGILLLNRKTVTLGSLMGVAVFTHVFLLNLSYDIPVKLFSMQVVISCLFLVSYDWKRITDFFFLNKSVEPGTSFAFAFSKPWQRIARIILKIGLIVLAIIIPLIEVKGVYRTETTNTDVKPIKSGVYEIKTFIKNNDTIPGSLNNEMSWKDFIFETDGTGSISTSDTLFKQRYRRGYFSYKADYFTRIFSFMKHKDTLPLFEFQYRIPDDKTIDMWGKIRNDSVYFELVRTDRHFQLTEKQFHWISESNR